MQRETMSGRGRPAVIWEGGRRGSISLDIASFTGFNSNRTHLDDIRESRRDTQTQRKTQHATMRVPETS